MTSALATYAFLTSKQDRGNAHPLVAIASDVTDWSEMGYLMKCQLALTEWVRIRIAGHLGVNTYPSNLDGRSVATPGDQIPPDFT
ncbi:MAG: hypothetical protein AB7F86_04220 [Bdellovibrionales bacterium]